VRSGAAYRAAVTDLEVADQRERAVEKGHRVGDVRRAFGDRLPRERADQQRAVLAADPVERGDAVQIDEVLKAREAQRQQRDEALPAGQHLRRRVSASSATASSTVVGAWCSKVGGFIGA
jgi:hypothetical protein